MRDLTPRWCSLWADAVERRINELQDSTTETSIGMFLLPFFFFPFFYFVVSLTTLSDLQSVWKDDEQRFLF